MDRGATLKILKLADEIAGASKSDSIKRRMALAKQYEIARYEPSAVVRAGQIHLPDYDEFRSLEELLAGIFSSDIDDAARAAIQEFDNIVVGMGQINRIPEILTKFENAMRAVFRDNLSGRLVRETTERLLDRGALAAGLSNGIRDAVAKNNVIEGIYEASKFYTNEHFSRNVMPRIWQKVDDVEKLNLAPTEHAKAIREYAMSAIDDQDYKLKLTANGAASRGYHYGVVKGAQEGGYVGYTFVAIQDERTSDVCLAMHGAQFPIENGVDWSTRRARATPEELPTVSPWFKLSDVAVEAEDDTWVRKAANELNVIGAVIPPLHANCRSSIRLY